MHVTPRNWYCGKPNTGPSQKWDRSSPNARETWHWFYRMSARSILLLGTAAQCFSGYTTIIVRVIWWYILTYGYLWGFITMVMPICNLKCIVQDGPSTLNPRPTSVTKQQHNNPFRGTRCAGTRILTWKKTRGFPRSQGLQTCWKLGEMEYEWDTHGKWVNIWWSTMDNTEKNTFSPHFHGQII